MNHLSMAWLPGVFVLLLASCATTEPQNVFVDVREPTIERDVFQPSHMPLGVVTLNSAETKGLFQPKFSCWVQCRVWSPGVHNREYDAVVDRISFIVKLEEKLWTESGAGDAILEHEETHRAIAEHYYARAQTVTSEIGHAIVKRTLPIDSSSYSHTVDQSLRDLNDALIREYVRVLVDRCKYAEERFDAITDKGQAAIASSTAMAKVLEEETAHWEQVKNLPPEDGPGPLQLTNP